jgi:uncharacterized OsmC-like protein
MSTADVAAALMRVKTVLQHSPRMGLHDDAPATARWQGATRVITTRANGTQMASDMPAELGGTGDLITPGWMFRAGLAACAATSIALRAVQEGIELTALQVKASSRSDTRGMLGMHEADGAPVFAGPGDLQLQVQIAAPGVSPERLHALVEAGCHCSPIPSAVRSAVPLDVRVDIV